MDIKKLINGLFLVFLLSSCTTKKSDYFIIVGKAQGSTYSIKYIAQEQKVTQKMIDSLLLQFDLSLSTYRADSKLSKINANDTTVVADSFLTTTFNYSKQIYKETQGLFDPTVGILVNAYGFGAEKVKEPIASSGIDSLRKFIGFDKVKLNKNNTITKAYPQIYFDFNAIAQGYSVDVVKDFLQKKGITNAIIEIGGEVYALGQNIITDKPWIIAIDNPLQQPDKRTYFCSIALENKGMATSGNYRKVKTDALGKKYVHIINPKTATTQKSAIISATVLAKSTALADGYATALMLMTLEESKTFLQNNNNIEALLLYTKNGKLQQYKTSKFSILETY